MELNASMHKYKHSKSDYSNMTEQFQFNIMSKSLDHPELNVEQSQNSFEQKTLQSSSTMTQDSLKQEILELRQELRNQFVTREALEEAICYTSVLHGSTHDSSISKPTKDLMKDVAALELEVLYLEKYLLSMYRKVLTSRKEPSCMMNRIPKPASVNHRQMHNIELQKSKETNTEANLRTHGVESMKSGDVLGNSHTECGDILGASLLADSTVQRSHSSLSRHSAIPLGTPSQRAVAEAIDSYQSLPLSMLEGSASACLGTSAHDHFWEAPSRISEEMIKRISAIIVQLANPPLPSYDFPPSSESLSSSRSSPQERHKSWSQLGTEKSCLDNSFHIETFEDYPSFSTSIEVQGICRDAQNLRKIRSMLQTYRCFVSALELVEPQKMRHEEKLAFWINVHNSLVMHALLVYGVQQNNAKRVSMLLKAAYNIGGHIITVDMIQCSILACKLPRPGQWLPSFFSQRGKEKNRFCLKSYAIVHPEPRLHFALCSGSKSDPLLRMYTPKGVFQELELAKEEYIQTNIINIQKEVKIQVPKKVETFIKESNMSSEGVVELIQHHCLLPQQMKSGRKIVWVPHTFSFRYLIANELVSW